MLAAYNFEADEKHCRSEYQQDDAKRRAAAAKNQTPAKPQEDADPEKAARDYCVQRRAAIAGERQGDIAKLGAIVSFLALAAAFAAVIFARQAAKAAEATAQQAIVSAGAARDAVEQMNRQVVVQMRIEQPFLYVQPGNPSEKRECIHFTICNFGKTPAVILRAYADCVVDNSMPAQPVYQRVMISGREVTLMTKDTWDGTVDVTHNPHGLTPVYNGTRSAFFWGLIVYEDVFGRVRGLSFGYEGSYNTQPAVNSTQVFTWERFGEGRYNSDSEEDIAG